MTEAEAPGQGAPQTTTNCLTVGLGERSYPIWIARGLLTDAALTLPWPQASSAMVVTNTTLERLHGDTLRRCLAVTYPNVRQVVLPDGEQYKDWHALNAVYDALLSQGCDRKSLIIAFGGGVIGDIAGFAAATFMRGIDFIQIPTTLLAQVDSSVGGKTAVNHPMGKNMIGAFHQPRAVLADLALLSTLAAREVAAGAAEIIKYGPIADAEFFAWLEHHIESLTALEPVALAKAVKRSCEIKAEVVGDDEKESGRRAVLNFGHTFGHAIEAGLGFGRWLHGEAVACGMLMAADLSVRMGMLDPGILQRLAAVVRRAGLPTHAPYIPMAEFLSHMQHDKKAEAGQIRFVLLQGLGSPVVRTAPDALVQQSVSAWMLEP